MTYSEAINKLVEAGRFNGRAIWHNGNEATFYAELKVLDDETNTVITPTEAELITAYDGYLADVTVKDADDVQRTQSMEGVMGIELLLKEVDADLVVLSGTPTNAQLKGALVNSIVRQRKILRALFYLVQNQG